MIREDLRVNETTVEKSNIQPYPSILYEKSFDFFLVRFIRVTITKGKAKKKQKKFLHHYSGFFIGLSRLGLWVGLPLAMGKNPKRNRPQKLASLSPRD